MSHITIVLSNLRALLLVLRTRLRVCTICVYAMFKVILACELCHLVLRTSPGRVCTVIKEEYFDVLVEAGEFISVSEYFRLKRVSNELIYQPNLRVRERKIITLT